MTKIGLAALLCFPLAVATAGPTVYATASNYATAGLSSFNTNIGVSNHNVVFTDVQVRPQVTPDGTKAAFVHQYPQGSFSVVVYSLQTGAQLGSVAVPSGGNLVLSPNSSLGFVNVIEAGANHVIEVDLDKFQVVLDVSYSSQLDQNFPQPIGISVDGATVFVEDPSTIYALDAATLQVKNTSSAVLPAGFLVTPNGKYLFGLVEISGRTEGIQFVSTASLAITNTVTLPALFAWGFNIDFQASGDGSQIVVLGTLSNYGSEPPQSIQPMAVLDLSSGTITDTAFPGGVYTAAAPNQDGSAIYLGDPNGLVSVFDPQSQMVTTGFKTAAGVEALQFRATDTLYVSYSAGLEPALSVDLGTDQVTSVFDLPGGSGPGFNMLVNSAGTRLYASGGPTIVDLQDSSIQRFGAVPAGHVAYRSLAWASGETGIWAGGPHSLDLLDPATLAVTRSILIAGGNVPLGINAIAITPDQTTAVISYGQKPNQGGGCGVIFVDLTTGVSAALLPLYAPTYIAISPDGKYAYIASVQLGQGYPAPYYPAISVVDLSTYQVARTISIPVGSNRTALSLAISADGATLYTTAAGKVFGVDAATGNILWTSVPGVSTIQVATIPGSTDLMTSDSGSSNLWRISASGQVIGPVNAGMSTSYLTVSGN